MKETRPNAILSFGDKQVAVSKERVEEILKHALATTGYNFDHYDYVKGLNDLKQAMVDWKPAEIPMNTRFETITLDLDAVCISGEIQDERKFGVNLFAIVSPPADGEIAFGEYVRNATLKNVKIASNSGVMLTTNSSLEFVEPTTCQRTMRCSVQLGIDNEEIALHLDIDKERGWMHINRSVNAKVIELEVAITSYRRDVQIGALRLDRTELDYLAKTPEVMAELVQKFVELGGNAGLLSVPVRADEKKVTREAIEQMLKTYLSEGMGVDINTVIALRESMAAMLFERLNDKKRV